MATEWGDRTMKRLLAILAVLLVAGPAWSAYYDMTELPKGSGYKHVITSTITASDYIRAKARSVNRIAFTQGSAFVATGYACETKEYAAATCTSVATLSATDHSITVETGREWLIFDVTTPEAVANTSYITIQSNPENAGAGGSGGVLEIAAASLPATGDSSKIYRLTDATDGADCDDTGGGSEQADCRWDGDSYEPIGVAATGLTNPLVTDLDGDGNEIASVVAVNDVKYADAAAAGSDTSGIQEMIDSYGTPGSTNDNHGGAGMLPEGAVVITETIEIGDTTYTTTTGMRNGTHTSGHGSGSFSNLGDKLGGTTLIWGGAQGGMMVRVTGFGHTLEHLQLDGRSCVDNYSTGGPPQTSGSPDGECDSDGTTNQVTAGYGIVQIGNNAGSGVPTGKNHYNDINITGIKNSGNGFPIYLGDPDGLLTGQNDQTIFTNVRMTGNDACIYSGDAQGLANLFISMDCTQYTSTRPIVLEYGGASFIGGFLGNSVNSAMGFAVDWCFTEVSVRGMNIENYGTDFTPIGSTNLNGGTCSWGSAYTSRFNENRILLGATNGAAVHHCIDWTHANALEVSGNTWQSNSNAALRKCDLRFNYAGSRDRVITMSGNRAAWNNGGATDNDDPSEDIAIVVTSTGTGSTTVTRNDAGRQEIIFAAGSSAAAVSSAMGRDATSLYADNNNDGDFDAGTDLRFSGVATDPLWAAQGDILLGNGDNVGIVLPKGAANYALIMDPTATIPVWTSNPGGAAGNLFDTLMSVKSTLASADRIMIEDSEASDAKKYTTFASLEAVLEPLLDLADMETIAANVLTWLGTPSSSNLIAALTDETGTGAAVFGTSPTIATPNLTGAIDWNDVAVNDDDCTGQLGEGWYDSTDDAFEFCEASSGTPNTLGSGGGGGITDSGTVLYGADARDFILGDGDSSAEAGELFWDDSTGILRVPILETEDPGDDLRAHTMLVNSAALTEPGVGLCKIGFIDDAGTDNLYKDCDDQALLRVDNDAAYHASVHTAAAIAPGSDGGFPTIIAQGTVALDTDAIASTACDTSDTAIAETGVASTDVILWTPNADISAITGYAPATTGGLIIYPYPGTNTVSFKVCNPTSSSITPGSAVTLNYKVIR